MEKLKAVEIRKIFLDFFAEKDHLIIPSSPLVPNNDPTLLFINSGMAPLKPYFLGLQEPPNRRLANYQACIRTKDIDDVGDRHHMTMFEMLGSWSIGDYYKEKAAEYAWDLLINRLKISPESLYVTVYAGNPDLNIEPDEETALAWQKVGVPKDRIVFLGEDNFWGPSGDTGPCGPCTEVFFDTGEKFGEKYYPGGHFDTKGRYIEIWNAGVFMELNKHADGSFTSLPLKSVDTGSGLERMEMVMNGYESVYETSGLSPILALIRKQYVSENFLVPQTRLMADHIRATCLILSEDVRPSNEGQGYIPRRLIRKCVSLAIKANKIDIDFSSIIDLVIELNKAAYPHLPGKKDQIKKWVAEEVNEFKPVITRGLELIKKEIFGKGKEFELTDRFLLDMVTSHGVPFDLIQDFAVTEGIQIDEKGYRELFEEHKNVSRSGPKKQGQSNTNNEKGNKLPTSLFSNLKQTVFEGYSKLELNSQVIALFSHDKNLDVLHSGDTAFIVLDKTPFYAESGGQVGDEGTISSDKFVAKVIDTQKQNDVFVHKVEVTQGEIRVGNNVKLTVNKIRRQQIQANHSATHLLHSALKKIIGPEAVQKGSLVEPHRLRFDFQHHSALKPDELKEIELLTNQWIRANTVADHKIMDLQSALSNGATAMFGEKYANDVRVVNLGENSLELCGGTHVHSTGDIGLFKITSETSVAKGIRRIEAVTGEYAIRYIQEREKLLQEACLLLRSNTSNVISEINKLKLAKEAKSNDSQSSQKSSILSEETVVLSNQLKLWIARIDSDNETLKKEMDVCLNSKRAEIAVLAGNYNGEVNVVVGVSKEHSHLINASTALKKLLPLVEGKGGGKPSFAQGAGKNCDGLLLLLKETHASVNSSIAQ